MGLTTDPKSPCLHKIGSDGQQACYLVLSDEERAKGFERPVRQSYIHAKCGTQTTMGLAIAETYARNPKFYGGTFCCFCREHFPLTTVDGPQFFWLDGEPVGSNTDEAKAFMEAKRAAEAARDAGRGI